ncbi:MAG: putative two-component sensor histidine kinase, partial [Chloroflexi bacterium]|nr:putative two-component sensor histidine kinase [Chloroflexota bacterium]
MSAFLTQVFSLLTTNTGSLAYNLVLAFSIIAALLTTFSQMHGRPPLQSAEQSAKRSANPFRRMLVGLSLLLLLRMALFLSAGLAWSELIDPGVVLPVLERGVDLLSLLVIVWLWAFPMASLAADIATALIALVLVTLTLYGVMAGLNLGIAQPFNGSIPDQNAQLIAITLAGLGVLFLAIRRPPGWPTGLVMLLANRADRDRSGLPVEQLLQDWAQAGDPHQTVEALASILAQDLNAELCLFLWPPDEAGRMVAHGYDLAHHLPIQDTLLESQSLPVIAPAFNQGSPLRLPRNSTAPDLPALAQSLNLERTGSLLAIPVLAASGQPLLQVIMLSPSSSRRWSSADEQRLATNSIPLAHILQRNHEIAMVQAELVETRLSLQST